MLKSHWEKVYVLLKNKECKFYRVTQAGNKLEGIINFDLYNVTLSRTYKQDRPVIELTIGQGQAFHFTVISEKEGP